MRATPEIERFVRDTLGCGCPDEVFEAVSLRRGPLRPGEADTACWIEVGGRLLIAVADAAATVGLPGVLDQVCTAGLRRRDASGFNRFRLVVPAVPGLDRAALDQAFAPLGSADERLHLHVVAPEALRPLNLKEATFT